MGLGKTYKDFDNDFSCDTLEEWNKFTWTGKLKNGKGYPDILCEACKAQ